jgi:hypothetical protein
MVNVVVGRKRSINVSANATAGVIDTSVPVTLKNNTLGTTVTRLDQLTDVDSATETNNGVLTYDGARDKYVIKLITFDEIYGDLDGGSF